MHYSSDLFLASLADDLVGVVVEPLAGRERATSLTVERGHRVGMLTHLLFGLLALGYDPIHRRLGRSRRWKSHRNV
jgi:hypothetical protein